MGDETEINPPHLRLSRSTFVCSPTAGQIPALVIALPAIISGFSTNDSTTVAVMFAVYTLVAGSADNVRKPLMLDRGVDAGALVERQELTSTTT